MYLHALIPVTGLWKEGISILKKEFKPNIFVYALISYSLILSVAYWDKISFVRTIQLFGILLFFGKINTFKVDLELIFKGLVPVTILKMVYDISKGVRFYQKEIYGFDLPRYPGILGEYNFSASAYLLFIFYFIEKKKYKLALFYFLFLLFTGSRAGLIALVLYFLARVLFHFAKNQKESLFKFLAIFAMIATIIFPIWTKTLNFEKKERINSILSRRVAIYENSFELAKKRPWGIGYFRISEKLEEMKKITPLKYDAVHTHNLILQILTSFGLFGLVIYILFFIKGNFKNLEFSYAAILAIMFTFMSIDALHEIALYLPICLRRQNSA